FTALWSNQELYTISKEKIIKDFKDAKIDTHSMTPALAVIRAILASPTKSISDKEFHKLVPDTELRYLLLRYNVFFRQYPNRQLSFHNRFVERYVSELLTENTTPTPIPTTPITSAKSRWW